MFFSNRYKYIVINIPKTGTKSFRFALQDFNDIVGHETELIPYNQHDPACVLRPRLEAAGYNWADYFKFVRVRNPWKRYASHFQWAQDFVALYRADPQKHEMYAATYRSLCQMLSRSPGESFRHLIETRQPQSYYFLDRNQETLVDYVGQLENIDTDFRVFCQKVGLPDLTLPQENKSTPYDYRELYTDELIELVAQKESYVIAQFNYTY